MTPRQAWRRWIPMAAGLLIILWAAFMFGAGPYYYYYGNTVTRLVGVHVPGISGRSHQTSMPPPSPDGSRASFAFGQLDGFRQGFARSGGDTNLARRDSETSPVGALVVGTLATFIPMSVLMKLSVVEFSGGRGLLLITDLDTVYINVALIAVLWVVFRRSRAQLRRDVPFLCLVLGLSVVSAVLLAYVVTNYGTLFRLRLLAVVPLWILPLALRHSADVSIAAVGQAREEEVGSVEPTPQGRDRGLVQSPGPL